MEHIITYLSGITIDVKLVLTILALFGIAIDFTPIIKFNPIRYLLRQFGKLLNAELYERIDKLEDKVEGNIYTQDQKRINQIRLAIWDFSSTLSSRQRDMEEYEEIFDMYDEYESLLKKYKGKNGRTTRAMENIRWHYDELRNIGH